MTNHPITPPPELVQQWRDVPEYATGLEKLTMVTLTTAKLQEIATLAARWGADQELEACCDTLQRHAHWDLAVFELMADRRPKSPSLKEQALETLKYPKDLWSQAEVDTIRRALEALPE
jgi:hypothetical protein